MEFPTVGYKITWIERKWYFVTKTVLTYCEKKNVLVIKKNFLRSLELLIQAVKGQNNFC